MAIAQLAYDTRDREAQVVAGILQQHAHRPRGACPIGEVLPAVVAHLNEKSREAKKNGDRSLILREE